MARSGYRVGILDTDNQAPGIHAVFGADNDRLDQEWNDYLRDDLLIWGRNNAPFLKYEQGIVAVMSGGVVLPLCNLKIHNIARLLQEGYDIEQLNQGILELTKRLYLDYLLIDTRPGFREETLFSLALSDGLVLVLSLNPQDFQGLAVAIDIAHKLNIPEIFLVANQINPALQRVEIQQQLEQAYDEAVIGLLPFCEEMLLLASSDLFCLRYPEHPLAIEIQSIAQRLIQSGANSRTLPSGLGKMPCDPFKLPLSQKPGLKMAELVDLPASQRQLISWMMRQGPVTLTEAITYTSQTKEDVRAILGTLIEQGFIQEDSSSGESYYKLRIAPKRGSCIGKNLWEF
ncbi:MAG: hypothetical protein Kow00121_29900 [Elainellaceae cyanobacterium]